MKDFDKIISKDNFTIKLIKKLQTDSNERRKADLFVLEGLRLCEDAVKNGIKIETLIVMERFLKTCKVDLELFEKASKKMFVVSDHLFEKISDTISPQGILCLCNVSTVEKVDKFDKSGKYIALENMQDPGNLGAVARTAEALGIDGLIISGLGCDPFSPKALRASMGALLRLPVFVTKNFYAQMEKLKNEGFVLYASVLSQADCYAGEVEFSGGEVIIIGNEAKGLSKNIIDISNKKITIKMRGKSESLNAATAAAILMWEMID